MKIKRFTDFILENEYYGDINEGDIIPGVPFNSGSNRTPSSMKEEIMAVFAHKDETIIGFNRGESGKEVGIHFRLSNDPLELKQGKAYAYIFESVSGEKEGRYSAAITKMEDFDADKSSGQLYNASNSIDLLANFMERSGIAGDATAGANLAKVITTLLLDPKYNAQVTDTFKKFANKISGEISRQGFLLKMATEFGNRGTKQDPGMKAFQAEFVKSKSALSPKKA